MLETITHVLQFYPFSLADTLALIPSLILFFQYLVKGQWDKLGQQAKALSLEAYEKIATDTQKRKEVLGKIEQSVPAVLKPIITTDALDKMINMVYLTQVKPAAKEAGLIKGEPAEETNTIDQLAANMLGAAVSKVIDEVEINLVR